VGRNDTTRVCAIQKKEKNSTGLCGKELIKLLQKFPIILLFAFAVLLIRLYELSLISARLDDNINTVQYELRGIDMTWYGASIYCSILMLTCLLLPFAPGNCLFHLLCSIVGLPFIGHRSVQYFTITLPSTEYGSLWIHIR